MRDADVVAALPSRRRILLVALIVAAAVAAIGAPRYLRAIESDLADRVPEALALAGHQGAVAEFSGQDGTVRCTRPLADPEEARQMASGVEGVRTIRLDRSCRVTTAPVVGSTVPATDPVAESDVGQLTAPTSDDRRPDDPASPTEPPAFESLIDLVGSDPQFSILASLVDDSGTDALVVGPAGRTLFAPTDRAFERLPADALAELRQDDELMAAVVRHHVVDAPWRSEELRTGELRTLDGAALDVVVGAGAPPTAPGSVPDGITVGGARVVVTDLTAVNGVVHSIDEVLFPSGFPLRALEPQPTLVALLDRGIIDLTGAVADSVQRAVVVSAARRSVDPSNVVDDLVVDAAADLDVALVASFGRVLGVATRSLGSGSVGIVDGTILVRGTSVDAAALEALREVADVEGAVLELEPRPTASAADLAGLQAELDAIAAATPIAFEPGGIAPDDAAAPVLDRLAAVTRRLGGVVVTVAGFTDTAGSATANQVLSEQRAASVALELVARGVPAEQLRSVGFGATRPVVVDGVEDPDASRRVEFTVEVDLALGGQG